MKVAFSLPIINDIIVGGGNTHTCHAECHQRPDLPLQGVGGDAGVVAGVAAGHLGEDQLAVALLNRSEEHTSELQSQR